MEPLEFGKFIVQIFEWIKEKITFLKECKRGQGIIKKRFGQPIKWRNNPRWYCKFPFIDTFDIVDMRKKYLFVNAHSFHSPEMNKSIIPYNIVIDVQVEYQVINPLVIYNEYGFNEGEEANTSYVNNTVQGILSNIIEEYGTTLNYNTLVTEIKNRQKEYTRPPLTLIEIKTFDNMCKNQKETFLNDLNTQECISISNIVVTSFDKNISLRTTT